MCVGSAIVAIVPIKCGLAINWVSFAGPSRHSGCAALAERFTAAAVRVSVEWGSGGGEGAKGSESEHLSQSARQVAV